MSDEFIGRGWAFPLRTDATGGIALVSREREIEEAIRLILGTSPGERPMRPGVRLPDPRLRLRPGRRRRPPAAIARRGHARARPLGAADRRRGRGRCSFDADDPAVLYIDIRYAIRATNDRRNLVFPFYVIPGE